VNSLSGIDTVFLENFSIKNPILISGLPGSGYVGKLSVDYLIEKFGAKKFAEIYSNSFPPQVSVSVNGTVELSKSVFYFSKHGELEIIFLTGDSQPVSPEGVYSLSEEIIRICKLYNVTEIFTLAAYITGKFTATTDVYGAGTTQNIIEQLKQYDVKPLNYGTITGMNGVLLGTAKKYSIRGTCLLGETSGYVVDAKASKSILTVLSKLINLSVDMSALDERMKDTEKAIQALQSQHSLKTPLEKNTQYQQEKSLGYIS